jgi:hypothetical protein
MSLAQVWIHFLFFTFLELKIENLKIWQCEHIEGSIDFFFQTKFLQFIWIYSNKIHINSETCQINIIKLTY